MWWSKKPGHWPKRELTNVRIEYPNELPQEPHRRERISLPMGQGRTFRLYIYTQTFQMKWFQSAVNFPWEQSLERKISGFHADSL